MKESIVLLLNTGKATAKTLALTTILHLCLFYMSNPIHQASINQLVVKFISDLIAFCTTPNYAPHIPQRVFSPHFELDPSFKKEFPILAMVEVAYVLNLVLIIFSAILTFTVFLAAKHPIWTYFAIFTSCYSLVVALFATPMMIYDTNSTLAMATVFGIVAFVFYIYFWVVWILGIGISKTCCIKLCQVKGLHLALLNCAYVFTHGIVTIVSKIILFLNEQWMDLSSGGLSAAIALCLVEFVIVVASLMLYMEWKEIQDKRVKLPVSIQPQ